MITLQSLEDASGQTLIPLAESAQRIGIGSTGLLRAARLAGL
jgi:hypothetical protein